VINEHLIRLTKIGKSAPARPHVWLEGNGVAARALLVDDPAFAYLDCLNQADGSERFCVIRSEHPAALTPANCGEGAYFAYGPGLSGIAAGLAVQMALTGLLECQQRASTRLGSTKRRPFSPKTRIPGSSLGVASVLFKRPHVLVHYPVIALLDESAEQCRDTDEDGGILIGNYRGPHLEITSFTRSAPGDERQCYSFMRQDSAHQKIATKAWRESRETTTFIGE
jgi:hypothetical protein